MYQYTNNSVPTFNKESSYRSLPEAYYQSTQPPQQQHQNYGWYTQQPMAAASAPMLVQPTSPTDAMTAILPPLPTTTTETPPSPPHLNNNNSNNSNNNNNNTAPTHQPKITTSLWEDEGTICYQVDAQGICVARRQDNDMINGTKLLNVTGMSRGKRDGILKNEKGRVVVKVGAMHLKGVWVTFSRAMALAIQHNIKDILHPLFVDDPSIYFYSNPMAPPHANYFIPTNQQVYMPQHSGAPPAPPTSSSTEEIYSPHRHSQQNQPTSATTTPSSSVDYLPSARAVPSMTSLGQQQDYYAFREPHNNSQQSIDHLDQHSLMDYASKGSSSMFSLTVSDSSPATPSQQSLFYDSTLSTVNSFPPSPHSTSIDYQSPQQQQFHQQRQHLQQISQQQYQQQQQQQQQHQQSQPQHDRKNSQSHMNPTIMMDLPIAPTLASNATLDSSFYYTHPCVSTTSFHDQQPSSQSSSQIMNPSSAKLPPSSSTLSSSSFNHHHHQATMDFYGSYTQSPSTHYPMPASAQPW